MSMSARRFEMLCVGARDRSRCSSGAVRQRYPPVINPPQAAILGAGTIRSILAREGDRIIDRRVLTLTLSCDHRILYGADAALFLRAIADRLEAPLELLI